MLMGKPVRSPRYTKTPRTPRSAHAKFYYTPSLIVHSPRVGSPNESGCESTANLMENHSRSASPREAPRPQHRPPSPPTPPTVPSAPSAFDNRAYQHDEADANHNDSFTSTNPQNGHSKEPNGETKTPEAVNLELINLTPKNGNGKKKDVEVDMNSANPYDEYFVSVNEHRKYMRGEKLYVTADKRGEKGGCKRPLCWTLLALVIAAVIALIVLAATGVLSSSSPTAVDQYNSSLSSARAFGGLTPSEHDHDHAHGHNHDHGHEHDYEDDHDAHDGHGHTDNTSNEPDVAQNDEEIPAQEESNESAMYVPRTLEGQLRIDNEVYTHALSDPDSEDYHQFISTFSEELRRALFNRSMLEDGDNDINVQVIELRNGSVIVTYRVHWNPKSGLESPKDLMTASSLKTNLDKYLATSNRMISVYHIAEDKMQASNVLDLCHLNNNDCSHGCIFDEKSLDFICTCPRGQILDMHNSKKCISIFEYSDQIHNQEPKNEVRVLENSNSESKDNSPNPASVSVADREHTIDWKDNGPASEESTTESETKTTHFSHVFGQPDEPEPSSEPISSGESELKLESKLSEPEPTAEPKAEPEPTAEPKAEPEPNAEPKAEPEFSSEHKTEPELTAEPKAEPKFSFEHKAEPEPTAEPKGKPEPSFEFNLEPETFADSKAEPERFAEPRAEPEPTAEPKAEPERTPEPKSEPEPSSELKSEHKSLNLPNAETVPTPEPKSEPEPTAELEPLPKTTSEPKAVFEHAPKSNPTPEQNLQTKQHPIAKPEFIIQSVTTLDAKQQTTPEPKSEHEPNADRYPQKELAITTKTVHELTTEFQSEHTPASTAKNSYEPDPTFISSLAGIIGVEPEHVFLQESEHSEDSESVIKPNTNNPIVIQNQSLSETASERNSSLNTTYLERKPTDYFNILKYVNGEKPIDTTTIKSPMVQNKSDENNSDDKDAAFFAIFQQDNEPITEINLKTTQNKTKTFDLESTTVMESSTDALHDQVYTNLMGEFPQKMQKTSNHMYLNNMLSTIKHNNQTTDENVDPLAILLNDKSISESTTMLSTMPSNSNTKEDFISGPLIEATTIAVSKEPRETVMKETSNRNDSAPTHLTENSKISFIIDDGTFLDTKDIKQTENLTELEPVTEAFITDDENSTETQEVGANSENKNGLQPNLATTESAPPENTDITFNMLLNRSSKAIVDSDFSNQTSNNVKMTLVNDTTTMESDWLSEPITEISYEHLMNKMDNQLTTDSSANAVAQVINGGHINDFEPDYLTHLGPTYAPEPNELLYTAMSDYDSQEARVKRVNPEERVSEIVTTINPEDTVSHSLLHSKGAQKVHNTSDMPTENNDNNFTTVQYLNQNSHNEPINKTTVNTVNEYIHRTTEEQQNNAPNRLIKNSTVNTVNEYIHRTTEKQQSEPAPVWEEPDLVKETSTKETLTASGEQKPFPAAPTTMANPENNTQENFNQVFTSTQISNLNVTIYEKPSNNNQTLATTKSPTSHSTEYDDHEKETNPFLPEVENNNHLVKKLQEGHDLEPSNLNDTQNDNTNEHSTLILDSIKSSSHNESSVKFSSSHQTIPATTTEEEDSFDDLLRESSNEPNSKTTEPEINDGDENINDDGLPLSTFLLDTDDLDVQTHKSTDSERIVDESHFTTNLPEAEDDDYLSVVPASLHGQSSEEREVSKKKYKSENIEEINDIIVDFSQKKSDKRTFHELNTSK